MATVQDINAEIGRIAAAKANIIGAIEQKGVSVPADAMIQDLPQKILDIPQPEPILEGLNVTPTTSQQIIIPQSPVDGYNKINVDAVTHEIDANIAPGNIKKDVEILGVVGTYEGETPIQDIVYSLENYALNGTAEKAIDTGLRLFNKTDFPRGFRIEASITLDFSQLELSQTFFRCRQVPSPYNGFVLRVSDNSLNDFYYTCVSPASIINLYFNINQRLKILVDFTTSPGASYWGNVFEEKLQGIYDFVPYNRTINDSLLIGGAKDNNGNWVFLSNCLIESLKVIRK